MKDWTAKREVLLPSLVGVSQNDHNYHKPQWSQFETKSATNCC